MSGAKMLLAAALVAVAVSLTIAAGAGAQTTPVCTVSSGPPVSVHCVGSILASPAGNAVVTLTFTYACVNPFHRDIYTSKTEVSSFDEAGDYAFDLTAQAPPCWVGGTLVPLSAKVAVSRDGTELAGVVVPL